MTTFDVIVKARKILSDPRRWGKHAYKQERDGETCYCALGALAAAAGVKTINRSTFSDGRTLCPAGPEYKAYEQARDAVKQFVPEIDSPWGGQIKPSIHRFNDRDATTYEDVMKLLSDAAQAEAPTP